MSDHVEQSTNEKKRNWLITSPDDENFLDCLTKACYGNERIAKLLNYFLVLASYEVENKHLEKSCKVVTFFVKHDSILKKLKFNISEKTLIRYLDLLNEWNYVNSQRYQREFAVNIENIRNAVKTPPEPPKKKAYNRHPQKCCSSTTLQPLTVDEHAELISLREKVVELQQNVDNLQLNVVKLQHFVDNLQLYNFESASVAKRAEGQNSESPYIYYYNITPNITKENIVASLRADDAPALNLSDEDVELGIAPEILQEVIQDFGKIETSSEQLEKALETIAENPPVEEMSPAQPPLLVLPIVKGNTNKEVVQGNEKPAGKRRGTRKTTKTVEPELSEEERAALASKEEAEKTVKAERVKKHDTIYDNLVKRRGGEVAPEKQTLEHKYIWKLVDEGVDPEAVDSWHEYLVTDDWRYNKPGDKQRVTAKIIYDERGQIKLTLADPEYQARVRNRQNQQNQKSRSTSAPSMAPQAKTQIPGRPQQITNMRELVAAERAKRGAIQA